MQRVQAPITGNELPGDPASPQHALAQFYRAFNRRDLALMAENWAHGDEIAMDNPLGGIKRGWLRAGGEELRLVIRTSRVFRKDAGRWRQVHHHGSIDDPQRMQRYRAAVLGAPWSARRETRGRPELVRA